MAYGSEPTTRATRGCGIFLDGPAAGRYFFCGRDAVVRRAGVLPLFGTPYDARGVLSLPRGEGWLVLAEVVRRSGYTPSCTRGARPAGVGCFGREACAMAVMRYNSCRVRGASTEDVAPREVAPALPLS